MNIKGYKEYLLNILSLSIDENNKIENDSIRILTYNITIQSKIIQLEKNNSVICTIYFYTQAPIIENIIFDYSSSIATDEYKAIELACNSFVFCTFNGIISFLKGVYQHDLISYILNYKKIYTVSESPIISLTNEYNNVDNYDIILERNPNFLWNIIKKDIKDIITNDRVNCIKLSITKVFNETIVADCSINNVDNAVLNSILEERFKQINYDFLYIKQFLFILQDDSTYKKYPYSKEEIEYFVIETILEFENSNNHYDTYIKNINGIIADNNIIEEMMNFIPNICLENAFPNIIFSDKVNVYVSKVRYSMYKNQFRSYKLIEDAVIDSFSNKIFKSDTFDKLVKMSSLYNKVNNIDENFIATFYFSDRYELI